MICLNFLKHDLLPLRGDSKFTNAFIDGSKCVLRTFTAFFGDFIEGEPRRTEETVIADDSLLVLGKEEGKQVFHLMLLLVAGTIISEADEVGVERLGESIHILGARQGHAIY